MNRKLNNSGFAIAGMLYTLLVIFLALIFSFLLMLNNRKTILDQIKKDVYNDLSGIISDEVSVDLNDLPNVMVEGTNYSLPSHFINTLKTDDNVICKIGDEVVTDTSNLQVGYYTINCQISAGDEVDSVEKELYVIAKGQPVYYNPETNSVCNETDSISTTGTKSGCMKWYIYADNSKNTFNMILDHNTTALVAWNSSRSNSEMKEVATSLASDTSTWNSNLNARLITADEIAKISGYTEFNQADSTYSNWFYFGSNNQSDTSLRSNYAWLYDYLNSCTSYGCNIADSSTKGYWTSSTVSGYSDRAWFIDKAGSLGRDTVSDSSYSGVRPVITVSKSLFYNINLMMNMKQMQITF